MREESDPSFTCGYGTIFLHTNTGTDGDPKMEVRVMCNATQKNDCGFDVPFLDVDGEQHQVGDWWVVSADILHYEELHRLHAERVRDE